MRRVGRWMLNGLTVLSLLLCVGTCVLWVRSWQRHVEFRPTVGSSHYYVVADGGRVALGHLPRALQAAASRLVDGANAPSGAISNREARAESVRSQLQRLQATTQLRWAARNGYSLGHGFGLLVGTTGLLCIMNLRRFMAAGRYREGCCVACGYDLQGNVSGVCPECGTPAARYDPNHATNRE